MQSLSCYTCYKSFPYNFGFAIKAPVNAPVSRNVDDKKMRSNAPQYKLSADPFSFQYDSVSVRKALRLGYGGAWFVSLLCL